MYIELDLLENLKPLDLGSDSCTPPPLLGTPFGYIVVSDPIHKASQDYVPTGAFRSAFAHALILVFAPGRFSCFESQRIGRV